MDINEIRNYKYTKDTHVKLLSGLCFRVRRVDFKSDESPIYIDDEDPCHITLTPLCPSAIKEIFEKTKPTIEELPHGTRFLFNGTKYIRVHDCYNVYGLQYSAIGLDRATDLLMANSIHVKGNDYELID